MTKVQDFSLFMGGGKAKRLVLLPTMSTWTCPLCRRRFQGQMSKAQHMKNFWKSRHDKTRCDWFGPASTGSSDVPDSAGDSESTEVQTGSEGSSETEDAPETEDADDSHGHAAAASAVITTPVPVVPLSSLAGRKRYCQIEERRRRIVSYTMSDAEVPPHMFPRDMVYVMEM